LTHQNQTKELTTWFVNLTPDESNNNKKHKVWSLNPRPPEAQLEDQKSQEKIKKSSRRGKSHKTNERHEKRQTKQNNKEELRKA
jgi:hypothetical protein